MPCTRSQLVMASTKQFELKTADPECSELGRQQSPAVSRKYGAFEVDGFAVRDHRDAAREIHDISDNRFKEANPMQSGCIVPTPLAV